MGDKMNQFSKSTIFDGDLDIVQELEISVSEIQEAVELNDRSRILDKITFLKFLVSEIRDILSGEYEDLRYRRFISKKGNYSSDPRA